MDAFLAEVRRSPLAILLLLKLQASVPGPFGALTKEELHGRVIECVADLRSHGAHYDACLARLVSAGRQWGHCDRWARALLRAPAAADWFRPIDRAGQVWVSRSGRAPAPESFDTDLSPFGADVPKPRGGLWTSSRIGALTSGWISYLQDGPEGYPPPYRSWAMQADPDARVYEITDWASWRALSAAYPQRRGGRVAPDWRHVASDWDAVHLSTPGLLLTYAVERAGIAPLDGWDCESTLWLRWSFDGAIELPEISEEQTFRADRWQPSCDDWTGTSDHS